MQVKKSVADRKAVLEARLADLRARMQSVEHELEAPADPDWEEAAIEREDDEVLEATGRVSQQEMRQVEAALHRLSTGDYGLCVRCGAQISEARLDALPHTSFCKECAR